MNNCINSLFESNYSPPEDWETKTVNQFGIIVTGGTPSTNNKDYWCGVFPWVTPSDITSSRDIFKTEREITKKGLEVLRKLPPNSVLVTCIASIGKNAILKHEGSCNQQINAIIPNEDHDHVFLYYLFEYSKKRLLQSAAKTATNIISKTTFSGLKFLIPPLPEQRAIAEVLSDVDALIEAQEALIEKKRLIKQGMMQELLTGKRRLPGFRGEWKEASLEELGEISSAGVDKKIRNDEIPVRLLNYMDVYSKDFVTSKDLKQKVTAPIQKAQKCSVQKGDIFFTPSSETPNDIANSAVSLEDIKDGTYSYHIVRFRLSESKKWDLFFRSYIFKTKFFLDQAEKICAGSGQRYVINLSGFQKLRIKFPEDKKEQQAISEIIYDIDTEIHLLEKHIEKCVLIKQGMMQEMLTGRTRLV